MVKDSTHLRQAQPGGDAPVGEQMSSDVVAETMIKVLYMLVSLLLRVLSGLVASAVFKTAARPVKAA